MEFTTTFLLSTLCTFLISTLGQDTSKMPLPEFVTHPKEYSFIVRQQPVTLTCEAYDAMDITFNCLGVKIDPERQQIFQSFLPETGRILVKATMDVTVNEVRGFEDYWCECYAWTSAGAMKNEDENIPQYILSRRGFVMIPYLQKEFDVEPTSQVVEEDSKVELRCVAPSGNPEPTIFWKKGGHRINPEQDSNLVVTVSGSLVIQNFQMTDEGNYTCVAKNLAGKVESSSATLTLQDYIMAGETHLFTQEMADEPAMDSGFLRQPDAKYFVTENSPVPMTCSVKGAEILEFRCGGSRIDEGKIDKDVQNEANAAERVITSIYRISKSEVVQYKRQNRKDISCTCFGWFIENQKWKGKESTAGTIKVADIGEKFGANLEDMEVAPGSTVSFRCRPPRGTPKPKVIWTLNGQQLADSARIQASDKTLTIQRVSARDAGEVSCIAQNVAGTRQISAQLTISDGAQMVDSSKETTDFPTTLMTTHAPGTPHFTDQLENMYYTSRRQPAVLTCGFTGARILTFRCNGNRLPQDQVKSEQDYDRSTNTESIRGTVEIQHGAVTTFLQERKAADPRDDSDYTCICVAWYSKPDNSWETVESEVTTIKPAFMAKRFMVEPADVAVRVGGTAVFECVPPRGGPDPTISWTKDNQVVDTSNRRFEMVEDGSLTIFKARRRDEGAYVCVATNVAGTVYSSAARLTVSGKVPQTTDAMVAEATTTETPQPETTEEMMMETTTEFDLKSGKPIFVKQPAEVSYILRNKPATITCRTLGAEYLQFECNGVQIPEAFHETYTDIDPETGLKILERSINITRDELEAAGRAKYECMCSALYADQELQGWAQIDKHGKVELAYLRKHFQKDPMGKTVQAGDAVEIECMAPNGKPAPTIMWERDGVELDEDADENIRVTSKGSLVFNAIMVEDEGNYTCVAENIHAKRRSMGAEILVTEEGGMKPKPEPEPETTPEPVDPVVSVAVDGPPVFVMELDKTSYVVEDGSVTLMCAAKQTGKISFMCNGEDIEDRVLLQDEEMDGEMVLKASLEIMGKSIYGLDVEYACECLAWYKISDNDPEQYVNSGRSIIELAYLDEEFGREPMDQQATVGQMATFRCVIPKGFPRPMTSWSKNGEKISFASNDNLVMPQDGSLVIVQVRASDAGSYSCSAENPAGTRTSGVAVLTVEGDSTTSIPEPETEPETEPEPETETETTPEMIDGNYTESVGETNVTSDVMPPAEYTTESMPENTTMYIDLGSDGVIHTGEVTPEPEPEGGNTGPEINPKYCQNLLDDCNSIASNMRCSKKHIECANEFVKECRSLMEEGLISMVTGLVQQCISGPSGGGPHGGGQNGGQGSTTGGGQEAGELPHPKCIKLQKCYSALLMKIDPTTFHTHDSCPDLKEFLSCAHDAMVACKIDSNKDASATLDDISGWFNEFCKRLPRRERVEEKCAEYSRCQPPIGLDITPEKLIDVKFWCGYISETSECRQIKTAGDECKVPKKQKLKSDLHYLETQAQKYCPKEAVAEPTKPVTGIKVDAVEDKDKDNGGSSMFTASILVSTIVQVLTVLVISFR